jgi:hypothetical protein
MRLAATLAAAVCWLAACSGQARSVLDDNQSARVYNALSGGFVSSVFFGVQSVDGSAVHAKFDRDRSISIAPGTRNLKLRYYAQNLWSAPEGEAECAVTVQARPGGVYRIEGMARDGRWRARLIDDRDAASSDCVFADGTTWGAVRGGAAGEVAAGAEGGRHGAAAATAGDAGRLAGAPAGRGDLEGMAAAKAGSPPPGSLAATAEKSLDPARASGADAAVESAPRAAAVETGGLFAGVRKVVTGRMEVDWGCDAGYLRARGLAADGTVVLKGSERVRLLGIESVEAASVDLDDACIRLAYDDESALAGERDRAGRLLAYVFLPDGRMVNEEMLRAGSARVETRWRHRYLGAFLAAQAAARAARRGIWSAD